ncbi:nucleotidyltransferase domain-containing protein [uncultured Clostridium sp.]|uniref:nucleotidyltransferase domain-containing protein n=1 Tax=uncultured Clostridium sp. TaxID=59620 RepID=UPI00260DF56E|nr:nucleotidyltransferase domain-containing protein [uncultured Clostridium sp.]
MSYFENNDYIEKVILFGSRAKGNYNYNSDIDIAILCDKEYKGLIANDLDEVVGIYSLDIVFLASIKNDIKLQVDKYGIEIYRRLEK